MSTLIRGGCVAADPYATVADDAGIPDGPVQLSLARWQAEGSALAAAGRVLAVRLPNTIDVRTLDPGILQVEAIILDFPGFADGRAYSQARVLRDALHYRGEIRATGAAVVRDQLHGMLRCGIDGFELRADQSPGSFLTALSDFSMAYQPAADALPRIPALRRRESIPQCAPTYPPVPNFPLK